MAREPLAFQWPCVHNQKTLQDTVQDTRFFSALSWGHPHWFLKRGEERERNIGVKNIYWLPLKSAPTGTKPTTQACSLTRNWTHELLVYRMTLQLIEPHQPRQKHWILQNLLHRLAQKCPWLSWHKCQLILFCQTLPTAEIHVGANIDNLFLFGHTTQVKISAPAKPCWRVVNFQLPLSKCSAQLTQSQLQLHILLQGYTTDKVNLKITQVFFPN